MAWSGIWFLSGLLYPTQVSSADKDFFFTAIHCSSLFLTALYCSLLFFTASDWRRAEPASFPLFQPGDRIGQKIVSFIF